MIPGYGQAGWEITTRGSKAQVMFLFGVTEKRSANRAAGVCTARTEYYVNDTEERELTA